MLEGQNMDGKFIIIHHNCTAQYKSVKHFYHLQTISNVLHKQIIRIFGIPSHSKGEVDHVGGTVKVAVWREIAAGGVLLDSNDIVSFLCTKFEASNQKYVIREINERELDIQCAEANYFQYPTIDGSYIFQAMVFDPNSVDFKASIIRCVWEQCAENYGSCDRFIEYNLAVYPLNKFALSSIKPEPEPEDDSDNDPDNENVEDFIYPESIVVVPGL